MEELKSIALIIGSINFVLYVAYVWGRFGVQKSISISFYDWEPKDRFTFRIFVWILSAAIILCGIGWGNPFFFIGGGLLSLVGFFTRIKVKWKYIIHMIGAIGGISSTFAGIMMINPEIGIMAAALILLQSMLSSFIGRVENFIWNIEIACFIWLISAMYYLVNF